ncbi:hypothetical protein [Paenibacillus thermotolerans]|uniref:hypothetical protein n=1 Tax=Paenibacillus thermotolerans TaxID=3027807 RepID=UPI002367ED43|nr:MULTISPECIES: hypothetical protein [unclassified Paenibacillus]
MADANEKGNPCLRCGYEPDKKDQYCVACGAPVVNRCMDEGGLLNEPCNNVCGPNAAFCPKCGCKTAFNKAGLVPSPYPENQVLARDETQEMNLFSHRFFMTD